MMTSSSREDDFGFDEIEVYEYQNSGVGVKVSCETPQQSQRRTAPSKRPGTGLPTPPTYPYQNPYEYHQNYQQPYYDHNWQHSHNAYQNMPPVFPRQPSSSDYYYNSYGYGHPSPYQSQNAFNYAYPTPTHPMFHSYPYHQNPSPFYPQSQTVPPSEAQKDESSDDDDWNDIVVVDYANKYQSTENGTAATNNWEGSSMHQDNLGSSSKKADPGPSKNNSRTGPNPILEVNVPKPTLPLDDVLPSYSSIRKSHPSSLEAVKNLPTKNKARKRPLSASDDHDLSLSLSRAKHRVSSRSYAAKPVRKDENLSKTGTSNAVDKGAESTVTLESSETLSSTGVAEIGQNSTTVPDPPSLIVGVDDVDPTKVSCFPKNALANPLESPTTSSDNVHQVSSDLMEIDQNDASIFDIRIRTDIFEDECENLTIEKTDLADDELEAI